MNLDVLKRIPFIQAQWFTATSGRTIDLICIHSMEAPEKGTTAEATARYFANGAGGRKASAHYCIDDNSIVQCLQTKDVAYAAPGINRNGIHLELAGYARQTREQWLDEFSTAMLKNAAKLCAVVLVPKYTIPVGYVSAAGLKRKQRGFTTHKQASDAFHPGGHWDPGPGFPMDLFLEWVLRARSGTLD